MGGRFGPVHWWILLTNPVFLQFLPGILVHSLKLYQIQSPLKGLVKLRADCRVSTNGKTQKLNSSFKRGLKAAWKNSWEANSKQLISEEKASVAQDKEKEDNQKLEELCSTPCISKFLKLWQNLQSFTHSINLYLLG